MIETKQNPVSILLQWIQGFVLVVAERRNVFYLRFFFITYAVLIIVNEPIKHILQGLILGHNAHNAAGYVPVRAQLHSLHSPALRRPPVNPTDAHGL